MKSKANPAHVLMVLLALVAPLPAATIFRVEHYVAHSQSPFAAGIASGDIFFNNFEAGSAGRFMPGLTMPFPGYTINGGNSIKEDIDMGGGRTLRSRTYVGSNYVFNFTPDAQGRLPRYFGIAFPTEVTGDSFPYRHEEVIGAKDAFGVSIFTNYVFSMPEGPGPPYNDDPAVWGIFFGFYNEAGISQVTLENAEWVDHLQFGYNVPEPGWMWVPAVVALGLRRRRVS